MDRWRLPGLRNIRQAQSHNAPNLFFEFGGYATHELLKLADEIVLNLKTGSSHGSYGVPEEEPGIFFRSSNPGL
jgi:hypothetical protein